MSDGDKAYVDGTHRVVAPEATLARVLPLARAMGVTRLAVLTGLDVLGIPTVAAVRPNSRSIAVHQGKGVTLAAAKVSALMEAAECFHAEQFDGMLRLATLDEVRATAQATDPARLPGRPSLAGERLLWVQGRDLMRGGVVWVPHELVTADYTAPVLEQRFQASTNGLASGNHWLEAVLHGLYELIERDALAMWHAEPPARLRARAVDLNSVDGPCAALLAAFARARLTVRVWEITSDVGIAAFECLVAPGDAADPVEPEFGSGCHADRGVALSRALTEAAQARLTRISGARDDFELDEFAASGKAALRRMAAHRLGPAGARALQAAPTHAATSLAADLDHVLARLRSVGCDQVAHVDLTRPELGLPVARMIVPGLEPPFLAPGAGHPRGPAPP